MDLPLDALAAASAALGRGEEAAQEDAWTTARDALDEVDRALDALRGRYRDLGGRERETLAALAAPLRRRRDALGARVPRPRAVSDGAPVVDPDEPDGPQGPRAPGAAHGP